MTKKIIFGSILAISIMATMFATISVVDAAKPGSEPQSYAIHASSGIGNITCPDGAIIPSLPWAWLTTSTDLDSDSAGGLGGVSISTPNNNGQSVFSGTIYKATINGNQFEFVGIGFSSGSGLSCSTTNNANNIPYTFVLSGTCGVGTTTTLITENGISTSVTQTVACV